MTRAARLLDLLQALRRHRHPVTAGVLAERLGVSRRTLYRDIATLIAQGAPIAGAAGLGYILNAGYLLPPLAFTADEADALILGLRLVSHRAGDTLAEAAAHALAKIEAVMPSPMQDAAATNGLLAGPRQVALSTHIDAIRDAIRREERLRLLYVSKAGATTHRLVWPVAIGFFETTEVVAAWCESRGAFRHFRLDRIIEASLTGVRFPRRHRVLLAEWRASQGLSGRL